MNSIIRDVVCLYHLSEDSRFALWLSFQPAKNGYGVWCDITKLSGGENRPQEIYEALQALFSTITPPEPETKLNLLFLDAYRDVIDEITPLTIQRFIEENEFVKKRIYERQQDSLLYRQPIILLLYYVLAHQKNRFREYWPLTDHEMQPLFTDLGHAFES